MHSILYFHLIFFNWILIGYVAFMHGYLLRHVLFKDSSPSVSLTIVRGLFFIFAYSCLALFFIPTAVFMLLFFVITAAVIHIAFRREVWTYCDSFRWFRSVKNLVLII